MRLDTELNCLFNNLYHLTAGGGDINTDGGAIFGGLNSEQEKAVRHVAGPLLILAGAGSGKTRVLVHRIAYLIKEAKVPPWSILAITFTNKAAKEMKERVEKLLPEESASIWISTFHSACVRMLRRDIERIGYSRYFSIVDADDQLSLIKECIKETGLSDAMYAPKTVLDQIGKAKDEMTWPQEFERINDYDIYRRNVAKIYTLYQKKLKKLNALDFDDIILLTIELLNACGDILDYYQNRFRHVLVDEYQDTNTAQYALITLLSGKWRNLCVVGDDDQSIYGWRGANIKNILGFENEYRDAKIIKLEQNYRSTKAILAAANSVILKNTKRKGKSLWTDNEDGSAIGCVNVENEHEEAFFVSQAIKKLHAEHGFGYNEIAVLYRVNAQSRAMENMLARADVPYRIIGGFKFFDRKEIKDVIAYLRLLQNPADDISFKRVINVPKRGVGAVSVEKLENRAAGAGLSIFGAAELAVASPGDFPELKPALGKIAGFVELIKALAAETNRMDMVGVLDAVIRYSGIYDMYASDKSEEARARLENVMELKSEILEFEKNYRGDEIYYEQADADLGVISNEPVVSSGSVVSSKSADNESADLGDDSSGTADNDAGAGVAASLRASEGAGASNTSLSEFLMHVALVSDIDGYDEENEKVSFMTMHSAKGLEYGAVFIVGAEEGIFPGQRSMLDESRMEEERRLCYVAITRAKKRLFITHAESRTLFGNTTYNRLSRFISDIPGHLLSEGADVGAAAPRGKRDGYSPAGKKDGYSLGGKRDGYSPAGKKDGYSPGGNRDGYSPGGRPGTRAAAPFAASSRTAAPFAAANTAGAASRDLYENNRVYNVGDVVGHKKYGDGVIVKRYLNKSDFIIEIDFCEAGLKRFIESMVSLRASGESGGDPNT